VLRAALLLLIVAAACSRTATPPPRPPSVLLITIDTLRADRVGCYGDVKARTPAMDGLADEGVLFEHAFSPVPITLASHASIFTGLPPPAHGVRGNGGFALAHSIPTLAEALRARSFATAAFVGGFPLARRFGLDRGFDVYDDTMEKPAGVNYDFAERRASAVGEAARAWLATRAGLVFLWAHFFDPHAPYDPPPAFRHDDPYRGEIASVDAAVAGLLQAWDARVAPSLVILTADHGEAFGEHGEVSHSLFVYDTTLRVPLILRGEGATRGRRVSAAVGITDLGATVLAVAGGSGPTLPGRSLLDPGFEPAPLYAETLAPRLDFGWSDLRSWRDGRYKLIRAPRPELYDVAADPMETGDLAAAQPEVVRKMSSALDVALAASGEKESRRAADAESVERLRSLGYVQGPGGRGSGADPKDNVAVARRIADAAGPFPDHATAARAYREIAALDPANPLVNFRLADALLRAGKAQEAVRYFQKVVRSGPRTADAYVGLAAALAEIGRLGEAEKALRLALAVDPANGQVHYNLGEIARARGDLAQARAGYEAALADPVTRDRARARLDALR
jgi:arylsulfatase A-like enzyme